MKTKQIDWSTFKSIITSKGLPVQYIEYASEYSIYSIDGFFSLECVLDKNPTDTTELDDFETNYKPLGNKKLLTTSGPFSSSDGFRARFKGFSGTATKNQITNLDFQITEERYINGVRLIVSEAEAGDSVDFQVVDVDNVLGYGAGLVLDTFGENWFIDASNCTQPDVLVPYPARIVAGLYIRIKYHSVGTTNDVAVKANIYLHKKS